MYIILTGLSHKTAPVDIRERCAFSSAKLQEIYQDLKAADILSGAVALVTCNRTEIYACAHDVRRGLARLQQILQEHSGMQDSGFAQYIYQHFSHHAIAHLFTVTAGLDSMVLGEQQIVGQIKTAYHRGLEAGALNGILNLLFQTALHVGKKTRTETGISKYPVSVSSAAIELCRGIFQSLENKKVLILGAGETSEMTARHLLSQGTQSVIVANRSYDNAVAMAETVNGTAVRLETMPRELCAADIVISCTAAPHFIIREDNCGSQIRSRSGRDLVLIDTAVPRDIEPSLGELGGVFLYDIDDLQNVVEANYKERLKAAHKAHTIIEQETDRFKERLAALELVPVIKSLKQFAENVKQEELAKALNRMGPVSEREENILSSLSHSIVNKLLHGPFATLKDKAVDDQGNLYANVIKDLFNLDVKLPLAGSGEPSPVAGAKPEKTAHKE